MRRLTALAVLVAAVVAASATVHAQPKAVTLELRGAPGSRLTYDNTMTFDMEMTMPNPGGGPHMLTIRPSVRGSARTETLVKSVAENGDLTLTTKLDSFDGSLDVADFHLQVGIYGESPGGSRAEFPTRGLVPPQLFKLPELPVQMVMDKRGKLIEIKGLAGLIPPIPGPQGMKINLGDYMTKVISQFSQPMFPDRPVMVGDKWETKMVVDPAQMTEALGVPMPPEAKQQMSAMKFPIQVTSTLVGFEDSGGTNCAKIEITAPWQLSMPMSPPPGGQGEAVTLRESGTSKGTLWFDYVAGKTVRQTVEFSMDMKAGPESKTMVKMTMKGNADSVLNNNP